MASTHAAAFTQTRPWTSDEFANLLDNPFTRYVGDARCFAVFQVIAGEAELLTIATHPQYQRQGLAERCMNLWHEKAMDLNASRAFLDVAADNSAALALYQKCGYRQCGLRKAYYSRKGSQNCDAIVMETTLP